MPFPMAAISWSIFLFSPSSLLARTVIDPPPARPVHLPARSPVRRAAERGVGLAGDEPGMEGPLAFIVPAMASP